VGRLGQVGGGVERRNGARARLVGAMAVVAATVAVVASPSGGPLSAPAAPPAAAAEAPDCTVTALLVNPCRPWLGAVAGSYPTAGSWKNQILAHEQRIGRSVDVVHAYHPVGDVTLDTEERFFVQRGSILYLNWKPANPWANATGGNATVNAQIDKMAAQLKSVAPRKIMLGLFGEPERFVTPGTSTCPRLRGSSGSPADFKEMWAFVQDRFAALGVTNVVWTMNYLGFDGWDCLFPELWPGNDRVDWITWDPYVGPGENWDAEVGYFYRAMERKNDATHDYMSKPWGLAEFGYWYGTNQAEAYRFYDDARTFLNSGNYPRLKLYEPFDTVSGGRDTRTSYTSLGLYDAAEQAKYNAFANEPIFTDPVTPPPPPPPPPPITDHLAACDTSVESGLSCFSGTYSGTISPRHLTTDGHTGTDSVSVTNTLLVTGAHGLNTKPAPVSATEVGRTYSGSVWVKASRLGMPVTLLLRERRADNTSPGFRSVSWTATDAEWHLLSADYVGKEAGNGLTLSVYGSNMATGQWIRADDFTLTSTV
jgi:hypothetical protein